MAEITEETDTDTTGPPEPPSPADAAGPSAAVDPGDVDPDPHVLRPRVEALSAEAADAGRVAIAVLSVLLRDDEQVTDLAVGRLNGANGVVALTTERLVLANDRPYRAEALEFPLAKGLDVTGWQDADRATIAISDERDSATLDDVIDRPSAQQLAAGVARALADR